MNALVSIIVPVYNVEKYLRQCILSLVEQTYKNIEIILVDDGSEDNSLCICKEFANRDKRIRIIKKRNGGLSDARNYGIDKANGEYICFVDSDDYISKYMIEKLLIVKSKNIDAQIVACNFSRDEEFTTSGQISRWNQKEFWENYYGPLYTQCVVAWNKLYEASLFNNIKFDKGRLHEDEFILHKLISKCTVVAFLDEKLYFYRIRENSITNKKNFQNLVDQFDAFRLRFDYFRARGDIYLEGKAQNSLFYTLFLMQSSFNSVQEKEIYTRKLENVKESIKENELKKYQLSLKIKICLFLINPKIYYILMHFKYRGTTVHEK